LLKGAYHLLNEEPKDRLDCLNKALQIQKILGGGMLFLNEVASSLHQDEFAEEDLRYIHESFCDLAAPILQMIEYLMERMEREARKHSLTV